MIERFNVIGVIDLDRPNSYWTDRQRLWECWDCGAVVISPERHQQWHDHQDGDR